MILCLRCWIFSAGVGGLISFCFVSHLQVDNTLTDQETPSNPHLFFVLLGEDCFVFYRRSQARMEGLSPSLQGSTAAWSAATPLQQLCHLGAWCDPGGCKAGMVTGYGICTAATESW